MQVRLAKTSANTKLVGGRQPSGRGKFLDVVDVDQASRVCRTYVVEHGLTQATWTGGALLDREGLLCGWITFDGTLKVIFGYQRTYNDFETRRSIDCWNLIPFGQFSYTLKRNLSGTITYCGAPALRVQYARQTGDVDVQQIDLHGWRHFDMIALFRDDVQLWLASLGASAETEPFLPWLHWQTRELHRDETEKQRLRDFI